MSSLNKIKGSSFLSDGDSFEEINNDWNQCLRDIGISETARILAKSEYDHGRRVYLNGGLVFKILLHKYTSSNHQRAQDLRGEFCILKHCEGCRGIASALDYKSSGNCEWMVMQHFKGVTLDESPSRTLNFVGFSRLVRLVIGISARGVAHADIRPRNILMSTNGEICLIDFDQARRMSVAQALFVNIFGGYMGGNVVFGSCFSILKNEIRKRIPPRVIRAIRKAIGRQRPNERLPQLSPAATEADKLMLKAWDIAQVSDASAPGTQLAYYAYDFGGYHFPGERLWSERWGLLGQLVSYRGKRILELGCNMGLLSCSLLKIGGASASLGVDRDSNILKSARLVALALGVKAEYAQIDFDSVDQWEEQLAAFKPDTVFALNVINWVKDKERFLSFLGQFEQVIVEGHDDAEIEIKRLSSVGFRRTVVAGFTERGRPVVIATK